MPRFARVLVPQCPHHVTQRGNVRRDIFFTSDDGHVFLGLLKRYADLYQIEVRLLPHNHVHLVMIPAAQPSLAKAMREIKMRSSRHSWAGPKTVTLTGNAAGLAARATLMAGISDAHH